MSKILIKSNIKSKDNEDTICCNGIIKDSKIYFNSNDVNTIITIKDKVITINRDSDESNVTLIFELNNNHITKYIIKEHNLKMLIESKTKKISINNNNFMVEYDLLVNGTFSDTFTYNFEWSEVK